MKNFERFHRICSSPSAFCLLPFDHGSTKRHCPARRRFRDDRLQGIARTSRMFPPRPRRASSSWRSRWVTSPTPPRRDCASGPRNCSAWSSPPSPIPFSRASFLPSRSARTNSATTSSSPTPTTSRRAKKPASGGCCPAAWTDCSSRRCIALKPRRGFIEELVARKIPTVLLGPPAPFCKSFRQRGNRGTQRQLPPPRNIC